MLDKGMPDVFRFLEGKGCRLHNYYCTHNEQKWVGINIIIINIAATKQGKQYPDNEKRLLLAHNF